MARNVRAGAARLAASPRRLELLLKEANARIGAVAAQLTPESRRTAKEQLDRIWGVSLRDALQLALEVRLPQVGSRSQSRHQVRLASRMGYVSRQVQGCGRDGLLPSRHIHVKVHLLSSVERFQVQKDGSYRIDQVVYVTRDTHKKIILGAGGQTIKSIGADSRKELMEIFEVPVHLFLFVKVREKWADDPERYREMGLEWTK